MVVMLRVKIRAWNSISNHPQESSIQNTIMNPLLFFFLRVFDVDHLKKNLY